MVVHTFDVMNWRPVNATDYIRLMNEVFQYSSAEPEMLETRIETLEDDRQRMVLYAEVKRIGRPDESELAPYLMTIIGEHGKLVSFVRTDVSLA